MKMHIAGILIVLSLIIGIGVGFLLSEITRTNLAESGTEVNPVYTEANVESYQFSFLTRATDFLPNNSTYAGFESCDPTGQTCTVYGINFESVANFFENMEYLVSFNDLGECELLSGRNYCYVTSDTTNVRIEPQFEETY